MPPRAVLSLQLAFGAMDAVRGRRKETISYITAEGVRKRISLSPYIADPDGYEGPEVLECIRPDHLNKKKKPETEHESESEPEPEQLHLYVTNTANKKVAHIPTGEEGDQYLLDFVMGTLEELEANGKDGLSELSLQACVFKVAEYFDVLDAESRLEPIWKHALNKLTSLKIESLSEMDDELLRMIEEDRENIYSNANRVTHVEERVDDVEEEVDDIKEEVNDIKTRLEQLELAEHLRNGSSLVSMPAAMASSMPEGLQRHWRAAREQKLDPNEVDKIRQYTDSEGFSVINPALRDHAANGTFLPLPIRRWKSALESGLRKIENYVGTVYRGSNMDADWIEEIKAKFNNRTRGVRVRIPFCDAAFLSASTKLHSAFKDTNCRFVIRSKSGKEIAAYSIHPFEYEVLFAPDTKFIIHDVVVLDSGKLLVRMRED